MSSLSPLQVISHGSRRSLAATQPADDPLIYPNGGTYLHPIAVSLESTDGSTIYYTTDGTSPGESSSFVNSGELIVIEDSTTLRTIAAYEAWSFNLLSSAEVESTFVVYSTGMGMFRRYGSCSLRVDVVGAAFRCCHLVQRDHRVGRFQTYIRGAC